MIVKKQEDKWLVDCRVMIKGKSTGYRKYFNSLKEATKYMIDYLEGKTKINLNDLESIAIFDNHGELFFLKEKNQS